MTKVIHSQKARLDLLSIWSYIAEDNPNAADKLLDTINEKCILLGETQHSQFQISKYCPDEVQKAGRYITLFAGFFAESKDGTAVVKPEIRHPIEAWECRT